MTNPHERMKQINDRREIIHSIVTTTASLVALVILAVGLAAIIGPAVPASNGAVTLMAGD